MENFLIELTWNMVDRFSPSISEYESLVLAEVKRALGITIGNQSNVGC
jgi:hypothetical protein